MKHKHRHSHHEIRGLITRLLGLIVVTLFYSFYYPVLGALTLLGSVFLLDLFKYEVISNLSGLNFVINNVQFNIIEACVAVFAYFLLVILILTTRDIGTSRGLKMFLLGFLLIFLGNVIRIFLLTTVFIDLGQEVFDKYHFLIWNFVSGVYVAIIWIFLVVRFKVKEVPIISDLKYLYNRSLLKKR